MKKPYIVAVAGGTCSGKSTLAAMLNDTFSKTKKTLLLTMDDYFKKPSPTVIAPITRKEYVEHNHPDTLELDRMYADYDAAADGGEYDLIIVEGLFALHLDRIRDRADLKVFVDLPSDERLVRRIVKHMGWGQTYEQVTERFLATVRFRHNELIEPSRWHADVVLNGTLDTHQGGDVLRAFISSRI